MSEEKSGQQQEAQEVQQEFKPITSQEELNKLIGERIGKVKSQYADYDDLKAKASKYDEVEAASKSELEKAQERIAELDRRATQAEQMALRTRIATEEGVIPEVLTGSTEEEMRAAAKRVLEWANQGKRPAPEPKRLKSGSSGEAQPTGSRAAAALRQMRGAN